MNDAVREGVGDFNWKILEVTDGRRKFLDVSLQKCLAICDR